MCTQKSTFYTYDMHNQLGYFCPPPLYTFFRNIYKNKIEINSLLLSMRAIVVFSIDTYMTLICDKDGFLFKWRAIYE